MKCTGCETLGETNVYPDDCTKGWSVWLLITLCIYMLTCEPRRISEGLVGTWIYHLPGTVNVGPHPLPAQGVMHGLYSIIATHGLTQANRALGWVILATGFSFCRARHYKWQRVTLVYGVFRNLKWGHKGFLFKCFCQKKSGQKTYSRESFFFLEKPFLTSICKGTSCGPH